MEMAVTSFHTCFNPHTHTGCDSMEMAVTSFHTCFNPHTHTGCDSMEMAVTSFHTCFNPHTHTGCDSEIKAKNYGKSVSIHTPIQGVTEVKNRLASARQFQSTHPYRVWHQWNRVQELDNRFQSTHPYRVWQLCSSSISVVWLFQSTHPYRVWRLKSWKIGTLICFNPHTHTGCDRIFSKRLNITMQR